ncbi:MULTISPECIES: hypothetical protein [Microcystis]|uniref:Uncharacterized protein n=1 Tax=Microcystis panniformis FACHB-1757 TaxID=1638788 RepID=A0A0K1S3B7_9CHRO|nr:MULTISPECIES: hypothetical protein [Microcystis]AKV68624.1 hypothetical protein VL20_3626 [Microcystis panniformis FACHB-1757]
MTASFDILAAVKRTAIPKPHDLGFCFFPEGFFAPALTDWLFWFLCGNEVYTDGFFVKIALKVLPDKHFTIP